jgi:Transposase domain (DUF772)/Transposase DDE domain
MNHKNVILQNEFPFGYSYDEMNTPFVKEYSKMFKHLDLSSIQRYSYGAGQVGYDNHSMIKAFIVYALEGYRSVLQLIRELKSKPYFSRYVLGFASTIPHNSKFYRFINSFDSEIIRKLLAKVNKEIYADNLPKRIAIDSKPIKANTKENNPKAFKKNLSKKKDKPRRNEEATLGYFSKSNDENTRKETVLFYWGYRIHIIVDPEKDIPLVFCLAENNKKDFDVAIPLYCKLAMYYPEFYQSGLSQLADKGYYVKKVFKAFNLLFNGKSYIPVNKRNTKNNPLRIPTCLKGLKMKYHSNWYDEKQDRFRVKFACPIKKEHCEYRKVKYGCTKYFQIRKPFPGEVQQHSPIFKKTYPKRQSVERVNAFIQNLGWENPKCYSMKAIENIVGLALLGKSLKTFI